MKPNVSIDVVIALQQLEGIGNKTIMNKIIGVLDPSQSLDTLEDLINFWPSVKGKKFEAITTYDLKKAFNKAQRILAESDKQVIQAISIYSRIYPEILKSCVDESGKLDPPLVLYYRGNSHLLDERGIAVIGTREPTPNGVKAGIHFSAELAKRGYNIVSGLAIGCDTTGHKGALSVDGATTAFLANGLDWNSIYPKENLELAQEIVDKGGLLLSEYPIGQSCGRYGLVARDRLQAGLSLATVVIQTGIKGGTMHAVNATLQAKKPLFAVEYKNPIDLNNEKVQGNQMLIKEKGAYPLRSSEIDQAISIIEKSMGNEQRKSEPKAIQTSIDDLL